MSTQRYISTSFWDDPWITTLDPSEKLLYLYLMTNTSTNIAGVYKLSVRRICFDTGFNSDTVGHIIAKFEKAKKVHRIGEYIALPSWPKHQNWQTRSKIKDGIIACLKELPESCLLELVKTGYKFDLKLVFDILSIPYTYHTNYSDSDLNSDSDSDIDSDLNSDIDSEIQAIPSKPKKYKHGEYNHVLLSTDENIKLSEEWGETELIRMIKVLDEGIETKGYKYKNHYLALRKWKEKDSTYSKPSSGLKVHERSMLDLED